MGAKGHVKGPRGENEVGKILVKWWGQVEPDPHFKRTPKSGGWGDAVVRGEFKVAGDLCTTAKFWPFTVEVKRREGWTFGTLSQGKRSPVWGWWRQCIVAAAEEDGIPLLWMRKNYRPWMVMAPEHDLVPILSRAGIEPDVVFRKLAPGVDDGDIRPALVMGEKFLALAPAAFLTRAQRRQAAALCLDANLSSVRAMSV